MNRVFNYLAAHARSFNLLYAALGLIWLKSYLIQRFVFDLPVEGWYQEAILLITPISSALLMVGLGLLLSRRHHEISLVIVSFISSFILFANMIFYRFFNDFITVPVLMQSKNMGDLGNSITGLIQPIDFLLFSDVVLIAYLIWGRKWQGSVLKRPQLVTVFTLGIALFFVNWSMAEVVRPELMTRTFDRQIMVKSIGTYNYHIYDVVVNSKMKSKKAFANSDDLIDAETYLEGRTKDKLDPTMFGAAKGRNVILVSMESLQTFVMEREMDGQEITPFLNDLIKDSYYFENFYHQTGQGKTSDAEFMIDNSLYPLPSGAVYFTHAQNTYNATPSILKEHGYYSAVFHANDKSFWNRDLMYQNLGYDHFFSLPDYEINDENSVGWGLKDIPFFEQSVEMAKELPQPFYGKFLTLTNHYPFDLDEEDKLISEYDSSSGTLNRYVTTVRYLDESIKALFDQMKQAGLYEDSIFVLYGDHYGISPNHYRSMAKFLEKETITPFDHVQLQKVPFIIHIPGMEGKRIETVSGQVDVKPTLLHLLGIETKHGLDFGHDMFAENRPSFAVLRDGSFITDKVVHTENTCYYARTGEPTEATACEPIVEQARQELQFSDEIIYGDLMRFLLDEDERELP
jgi:lipoteichoic acid synthase